MPDCRLSVYTPELPNSGMSVPPLLGHKVGLKSREMANLTSATNDQCQ